jgi:hypothetical protein
MAVSGKDFSVFFRKLFSEFLKGGVGLGVELFQKLFCPLPSLEFFQKLFCIVGSVAMRE